MSGPHQDTMYQSLACPQSVYRDLRRFALAFAYESGKAAAERVLPAHRHIPTSARRVWPHLRAALRRIFYCACSRSERVVAGSGRLLNAASILAHADAIAQQIWQMRMENLAAAAQFSEML
jgi:hypothetical protein